MNEARVLSKRRDRERDRLAHEPDHSPRLQARRRNRQLEPSVLPPPTPKRLTLIGTGVRSPFRGFRSSIAPTSARSYPALRAGLRLTPYLRRISSMEIPPSDLYRASERLMISMKSGCVLTTQSSHWSESTGTRAATGLPRRVSTKVSFLACSRRG